MQAANPLYPSPINVCTKQFCRIELWYANSHTGITQKNKNPDKNSSLLLSHLLLDFTSPPCLLLERSEVLQPCTGAQLPSRQLHTESHMAEAAGNKNSAITLDVASPIAVSHHLKQKACTWNQPLPDSVLRQPKGSEVLQFHGADRPAGLKFLLCWSFLSASAAQTF